MTDPALSELWVLRLDTLGKTYCIVGHEKTLYEELRRQVLPFAEARGYLTDEDIAAEVS